MTTKTNSSVKWKQIAGNSTPKVLRYPNSNNLSTFNDTHGGKPCLNKFSTRIYWNRILATSDLFQVFTQSINPYTFGCFFQQVLRQTLSWFLSWHRKILFLRGFILKSIERAKVLLRNDTRDFQNSIPFWENGMFLCDNHCKFCNWLWVRIPLLSLKDRTLF